MNHGHIRARRGGKRGLKGYCDAAPNQAIYGDFIKSQIKGFNLRSRRKPDGAVFLADNCFVFQDF